MPIIEIGGESVDIEADCHGLTLTSDALFMDGWLCLSWADGATLERVLAEARAEQMHGEASR